MPNFRDGTVNIAALQNPGVYIDQILPQPFINGVPTNIMGLVGVGSWGPTNAVQFFSSLDQCAGIYGIPTIRPYDLASYVMVGLQEGISIGFAGVRVTDGTDTAASVSLPASAGSFTAKYTGVRGNQITAVFQATTQAGAYAAVVNFPGRTPERFDNITGALATLTVTAGTGYTSVPALSFAAPTAIGGRRAVAQASLVTSGTPTVTSGGTGYAVNDKITYVNGLVVNVTAVSGGVVTTISVVTPGAVQTGSAPTAPLTQSSTTGVGTGCTITPAWVLGPATIVDAGSGYTTGVLSPTMTGGGGSGGSYVGAASFWGGLAYAVNHGTVQRGASNYVVFTPSTGTGAPTLATSYALTGGTDGANGVTPNLLVGTDVRPRTGMYALRSSKADSFALCDVTDSSTWSTQLSFAISESMLAVTGTAANDTIQNCVATRLSQGIDDPNIWIITGDYTSIYDSQYGAARLMSPVATAIGLLGNLSPELSPINKRLNSVIGTQTSAQGIIVDDADESVAQIGGIDIIGRSDALNQGFFSFLTGRNSSSNTAANGVEYTRLTNFIIRSLESSATRSIIGKQQSIQKDDPTRREADAILTSFFRTLQNPAFGSGGYGLIDEFSVQCDLTNNTPDTIARGYLFAFCRVRYLATVRYFVIKLDGGVNVDVSVQTDKPSLSQLLATV
jgi:hypothetical protein